MTDEAVKLAREVIEKYGVDADKPSVHLARAVLEIQEERERMRAALDYSTSQLIGAADFGGTSTDDYNIRTKARDYRKEFALGHDFERQELSDRDHMNRAVADRTKLRAALKDALDGWDEVYEGEGYWPENRDSRIAQMRKEWGL
jgi:hypothetical protein